MKQETCGAGGVYLSSGRERSGFRRVDFDLCPNQILERSLWNLYKEIISVCGQKNLNSGFVKF